MNTYVLKHEECQKAEAKITPAKAFERFARHKKIIEAEENGRV